LGCARLLRCAHVTALCLLLWACGEQNPPEQRIRALIGDMELAVESGEKLGLDTYLHERYSDPWHKSRREAMATLIKLMFRHRGVHLFTVIRSIEPNTGQDAASAVVYAAMTGVPVESVDALISLKADLYRFDIELVEEDGAWWIIGSRWERIDPSVL